MILLKNARVVEFYPPKVSGLADVMLDGNLIKETGTNLSEKYSDIELVLDLKGKFISPGIVCSHNHFYSALARGIMANIPPSTDFVAILKNLWWRLDRALDEESIYYSCITAALDAIKCGTTSVIDHHASPNYIMGSLSILKTAFMQAGLRGILCYEITDRNGELGALCGLSESIAASDKIKEDKKDDRTNDLLRIAIGGHAPFTLSNKTLELMSKAVNGENTGVHIHVSEDSYDRAYSHHFHSNEVLERLEKFGMLNRKAIIVHGVYLTEKDIKILNKHDAFLIHNPRSNMNNSVGYSEKLSKIKNLGLGTDGIGSDMFEEVKFAFFKNGDAKGALGYGDFLKIFNTGNTIMNRYFDLPFGKIEAGNVADIVVYDYNTPTPITENNLAGHLLFGLSSQHVETTIINGKIVYQDRKFPFDIEEIYAKSRESAKKLWEKTNKIH